MTVTRKRISTFLGFIIGTAILNIISNLLTPESKTFTKMIVTICNNFSIISSTICAFILIGLVIKWIIADMLDDEKKKRNEIRSNFKQYKNIIDTLRIMESYRAVDKPVPPNLFVKLQELDSLKDLDLEN